MKLKEKIINDFLADEKRNFVIFQTSFAELSVMYDRMVNALKSGESFKKFLMFENATGADGKIRYDRQISYFDKEIKKDIRTKLVFKFPVYSYFFNRYQEAISSIKQRDMEALKTI